MCELKKGDKVICINTDNHSELIKNKIYEVEKLNGDFIYLKNCKNGYFTFLFRKECEYCKNDGYYKDNKSLISKKLRNNVDIDLSINVKDKKLVASIENLKNKTYDDNWIIATRKINYCPICREKVKGCEQMLNISLKEMFNYLIEHIFKGKKLPTFYYKRANFYTESDEYVEITEVDLMRGRFKTIDDDFSEYDWEKGQSNIYIKEDKQ